LLLDEPLSALDAKLRQQLLIELDAIHDKIGITFIYVTHDQQEALSVSDRIAVMKDGNILQIGTPAEIYESPSDLFVANFIGDSNMLEGKVIEINGENATVDVVNIGKIFISTEKEIKVGNTIKMTIRPEKIRITKTPPDNSKNQLNILNGKVDELTYSGFLSRYYVIVNNKIMFKTFKQHVKYYMDEVPINWKDSVYIWWNIDDEYIVEVERS